MCSVYTAAITPRVCTSVLFIVLLFNLATALVLCISTQHSKISIMLLFFYREELKQLRNEMFEIEKSLVSQVCMLYDVTQAYFNMYVHSS